MPLIDSTRFGDLYFVMFAVSSPLSFLRSLNYLADKTYLSAPRIKVRATSIAYGRGYFHLVRLDGQTTRLTPVLLISDLCLPANPLSSTHLPLRSNSRVFSLQFAYLLLLDFAC